MCSQFELTAAKVPGKMINAAISLVADVTDERIRS